MANLTITNYDMGGVVLDNAKYVDGTLQFAGADTYVKGTILAVRAVATAVVVAAGGSNTGNGTVTVATVAGAAVPKVGAYAFTFTAALVANLIDPDGLVVASNIAIADGAAIVLNFGGLQFTVTDGGTAFVATDTFSLTVAADGDYVAYDKDGVGGSQNPKAILTLETVATGASDIQIRPLISGMVRKDKLVVDAVGTAGTVTDAEVEALRDYTIIATQVSEVNVLDTQD